MNHSKKALCLLLAALLTLPAAACTPDAATPPPSPATSSPARPSAPTPPATRSATVFYIAPNDGGVSGPEVGCGDSAISVTSPLEGNADPVTGALEMLLNNHNQEIGQSGLQNTLWRSVLKVDSVDRQAQLTTIHLSGTVTLAGECDIPRAEAQLLMTAGSASGTAVTITLNGKELAQALSLQ